MARNRSRGEEAEGRYPGAALPADDGRLLASLAGEGQAMRRGNALRPGWRPVHTHGVLLTGTFSPSGRRRSQRTGALAARSGRHGDCQVLELSGSPRQRRSPARPAGPRRALHSRERRQHGPRDDEHQPVHRDVTIGVHLSLKGDEQLATAANDPGSLAGCRPSDPGTIDVPVLVSAHQLCRVRVPRDPHVRLDDEREAAGALPLAPSRWIGTEVAVEHVAQTARLPRARPALSRQGLRCHLLPRGAATRGREPCSAARRRDDRCPDVCHGRLSADSFSTRSSSATQRSVSIGCSSVRSTCFPASRCSRATS